MTQSIQPYSEEGFAAFREQAQQAQEALAAMRNALENWAKQEGVSPEVSLEREIPDGPFFPQGQAGVDQLKLIPGHEPLMASASTALSGWMEWIKSQVIG